MQRVLNFDYLANVPRQSIDLECNLLGLGWNPQSLHALGQRASAHLALARETILQQGFDRFAVTEFPPGGASVANRRAILGSLPRRPRVISPGIRRDVVLLSNIEHASILHHVTAELKERQYTVALINCRNDGVVDLEHTQMLLTTYGERIALVSVMLVNNETGIYQPVQEVVRRTHKTSPNAVVHSDITQGVDHFWSCFPKHSCTADDADALPDVVTFSGYKLGGPHIGILLAVKPLMHIEYNGTPDVASIHEMSVILQRRYEDWLAKSTTTSPKPRLAEEMLAIMTQRLGAADVHWKVISTGTCLPNVLSCVFPGFQAKMIQQSLSACNVCIGTGSACQSNTAASGSHVLSAMGYPTETTFGLIRLSWDPATTSIADAVDVAQRLCDSLLHMHPLVKNRTSREGKMLVPCSTNTRVLTPNATTSEILQRFEARLAAAQAHEETQAASHVQLERKLHLGLSEAYLKGGNRCRFIQHLLNDVRHRLKALSGNNEWTVRNMQHYIDVLPPNTTATECFKDAEDMLCLVPGLSTVVPVMYSRNVKRLTDLMPTITEVFQQAMIEQNDTRHVSFAVRTKVTGAKHFDSFHSQHINAILGSLILKRFTDAFIQLTRPTIELQVILRADVNCVEVFASKRVGLAGLPLKSEDPVAVLLEPENVLRTLYSSTLLSTRGVRLVCYHIPGAYVTSFQESLHRVNPYVKYIALPGSSYNRMESMLSVALPLIQERLVFYERCTDDVTRYLVELKAYATRAGLAKSITAITPHMSHLEMDEFLRTTLRIDRSYSTESKSEFHVATDSTTSNDNSDSGMISMLSGGIDSPVATALAAQYCRSHTRPFKMIHFSSNINKIEAVLNIRDRVAPGCELVVVEFLRLQDAITAACPESYRVMLFKVFMIQIANLVARQHQLGCVVMGNSLGQVASQTCENLFVTEHVSDLPLFNPLLGLPKAEIINQARVLGTYEASISGGSTDCCVLYLPNHPTLHARTDIVHTFLAKFENFMDLVSIHSF